MSLHPCTSVQHFHNSFPVVVLFISRLSYLKATISCIMFCSSMMAENSDVFTFLRDRGVSEEAITLMEEQKVTCSDEYVWDNQRRAVRSMAITTTRRSKRTRGAAEWSFAPQSGYVHINWHSWVTLLVLIHKIVVAYFNTVSINSLMQLTLSISLGLPCLKVKKWSTTNKPPSWGIFVYRLPASKVASIH